MIFVFLIFLKSKQWEAILVINSYFLGTGLGILIHDFEEAAKWYRLAAEQGYAAALGNNRVTGKQLSLWYFADWALLL